MSTSLVIICIRVLCQDRKKLYKLIESLNHCKYGKLPSSLETDDTSSLSSESNCFNLTLPLGSTLGVGTADDAYRSDKNESFYSWYLLGLKVSEQMGGRREA